ncbi:SNX11 protein, partial [Polypterus senegalus]
MEGISSPDCYMPTSPGLLHCHVFPQGIMGLGVYRLILVEFLDDPRRCCRDWGPILDCLSWTSFRTARQRYSDSASWWDIKGAASHCSVSQRRKEGGRSLRGGVEEALTEKESEIEREQKPVPELPVKTPFFTLDNEDFIENRRKGLQQFLERVLKMTVLLSDSHLHLFLQTQLSVTAIEQCVQGCGPHSVTGAILAYASSNLGWVQEEGAGDES